LSLWFNHSLGQSWEGNFSTNEIPFMCH
jgi:hypothetical protein